MLNMTVCCPERSLRELLFNLIQFPHRVNPYLRRIIDTDQYIL